MRTEEERLNFCGTICHAAHRIGIGLSYFTHKGKHRYIWADPAPGIIIECNVADSQPEALEIACDALTDYFSPTISNDQGQPSES